MNIYIYNDCDSKTEDSKIAEGTTLSMKSQMNFFIAYVSTYIYFISITLIFKIVNSGLNGLRAFLVYYTLYGSIVIIFGCLIIESISKGIQDPKIVLVLFIGFLYGLVLSFLFGSTVELDMIYINLDAGLITSLGFLIYYFIRQRK